MPYLTESAILECEWNGDICTKVLNITPVTRPNEKITIAGKASNYVNNATIYLFIGQEIFLTSMQNPINPNFILNYIPTGIFTIFTNLVAFRLSNTSTSNLVTDAVKNCGNLINLELVMGTIKTIPFGFAQTCSKIQKVNFNSNQIDTIDINAFKGLTNLISLNLNFNNIKCIPSGLFQTIPLITEIGLESNKITALDSSTFINLPHLYRLNLKSNLLTYLHTVDLSAPNILGSVLNVMGNTISALEPDFFSIFNKTKSLIIFFDNLSCLTIQPRIMITNSNYQNYLHQLQTCFSNWLPSMSSIVPCIQQTTPAPTRTCSLGKNCRKRCFVLPL